MKVKVSDYVARFLVDHGIHHAFTVTGGGAMHLNDSLGHCEGLTCIYNHHEQACGIAAEAYARVNNTIAAVCVTTGPGGINAMNGVAGAYLDSIPMLVVSGQVRYDTTARSTGLDIRAMGDQEFDICRAVESMTKYCEMVVDPLRIRHCLEKAYVMATTGRPGPCWLDIPLNVQGATVETDDLEGFDDAAYRATLPPKPDDATVDAVLDKIAAAQRPVFYAGNGIRIAGAYDVFRRVAELMNIPIVTCWDSIDLVATDNPLYVGRGGIMGDRAGNFAVQNSDVLFALGNRLSIRQVGYNWTTWARESFVIMCDVAADEMKKPTLHVEMPVWADAADMLQAMERRLTQRALEHGVLFGGEDWLTTCRTWKERYPVVQPKHLEPASPANVYAAIDAIGKQTHDGQITVVGNGSACVVGSHAYLIRHNARFLINSAIASMGYDLPAAIGACVAQHGDGALNGASLGADCLDTVLITGDGSIQMNLQELQTIIHHKMPVKIFLINNQGYHSIRQTQTNLFNANFVGIGPQSGDLSFPDMGKLAQAYGYPYIACDATQDIAAAVERAMAIDGPAICEIFVSITQNFEPKSSTKKLEDGSLFSPPLEDLAPFLPREELRELMFIRLMEE